VIPWAHSTCGFGLIQPPSQEGPQLVKQHVKQHVLPDCGHLRVTLFLCTLNMQELGSLMLKAGKAGDASKYLQQALEMTVGTVVCVIFIGMQVG